MPLAAESTRVDMGTLVVSLSVALIALLPRVPGFSADERRRARIYGDTELWKSMPEGAAREALAEHIGTATAEMLAERARDRTLRTGWLYGSGWMFAGWALVVGSTALPEGQGWAASVRALMVWLGAGVALAGLAVLVLVALALSFKVISPMLARRAARTSARREPGAGVHEGPNLPGATAP